MQAILLPAERHGKSRRGTPRLRHPLRALHGAVRLAAPTTALTSLPWHLEAALDAQSLMTMFFTHPSAGHLPEARRRLLSPLRRRPCAFGPAGAHAGPD